MILLLQMSRCTGGVHLLKRKIVHSRAHRLFWIENHVMRGQRIKRDLSAAETFLEPAARPSLSRRHVAALVPCWFPLGGFYGPLTKSSWTATHFGASYSSSSKSKPTIQHGVDNTYVPSTEKREPPTTIPFKDVRRIMFLAHPERWRLSGVTTFSNIHSTDA